MEIANSWADGKDLARRSRPRDDDDNNIKRDKDSSKRRDCGKDRCEKRRDDVRHIAAGYTDRRDDKGDTRRDDRRDDQRDPKKDDRRGGSSNYRKEPMNWVPRVANIS